MPLYDDWLSNGPRVWCADCGCSLGHLNDGDGHEHNGDTVCDDCFEQRLEDERAEAEEAAEEVA